MKFKSTSQRPLFLFTFALSALLFTSACSGEEEKKEDEKPTELTHFDKLDACDCKELVHDMKYNHFYLEDRTKGYTGKCIQLYPNGNIEFEKNYVEGKMEGPVRLYHESGELSEIKNFSKNFQDGNHTYFDKNGDTIEQFYYERGALLRQTYPTATEAPVEN